MLKLLLMLPVLILLTNLVFLDYQYVGKVRDADSQKVRESELESKITSLEGKLSNFSPPTATISAAKTTTIDACPQLCQAAIDNLVKTIPKSSTTPVAAKKAESFVPMGTGQITKTGDWVTVDSAQVKFNIDDYLANSAFYFETIMHTAVSGEVRARLYDVTTPNIYAGEVLATQSTTGELSSVQMKYLLHGSKIYKVQMNTSIATAVLDLARIRVVTQ